MSRANPCKERAVGCTGDPKFGGTRCDNCRNVHNARENARRRARRKQCACWVCGAEARVVGDEYQATCAKHVHYRSEVSA